MTLDEIKQYKLETEIERLRDDNERLRAALQELWNQLGYMDGDKPHRLCAIARRALEPKP